MATTVMTTAQAILRARQSATPAVVYVDGLPNSRLRWFGVELRRLSIRTNKIVGGRREEADALIRLADACCGFVRAALLAQQLDMTALFQKAKASGHLTELLKMPHIAWGKKMGSLSSCEAPTNTGSVRLPNQLQSTRSRVDPMVRNGNPPRAP